MLYATMRIGNNCEYFLFQSITEFLLPEVLNGGQFFGHKLEFGAFEPLFEDFTGRFSPAIQCRRTVFVKSILAPKKKGVVRGCGQQYV